MHLVRDSVEPEDFFEDQDLLPCSSQAPPAQATPITFDLPSTTSIPTQPSSTIVNTQLSKTPVASAKSSKRQKTVDDTTNVKVTRDADLWEFPIQSPARPPTKQSTIMNNPSTKGNSKVLEEIPYQSTRRHSMTAVTEKLETTERLRSSSVGIEESSQIPKRKRKLTGQIDDSDTERIESPGPECSTISR